MSHTNTGAPIREVTIPTGISDGAITIRETVSAASKKSAPSITEQGTANL